jgi:Rrf2 family protein
MWLSSTARQALHAVLCVAVFDDNGPVRVEEIAAATGGPRNYLSKTLHALARAGVLRSTRGPTGGFQLAESPDAIPLERVIAPFDAVGERRCLMGLPSCSDAHPCAIHDRWSSVATVVEKFFRETTVAGLLSGNPRAVNAARNAILTSRRRNRRKSDGSIKRKT